MSGLRGTHTVAYTKIASAVDCKKIAKKLIGVANRAFDFHSGRRLIHATPAFGEYWHYR
jgi:hypothetical protein